EGTCLRFHPARESNPGPLSCETVLYKKIFSYTGREKTMLTYDGFVKFMTSPDCCIFNQAHNKIYQRMDLPLVNYFIASSHNTFFMNDQLIGWSNLHGYISALKKGCRCLEIVCCDGPENEPMVYHGLATSSQILFKDVINVVNLYAFEASDYPLILSLEVHCNPVQQHSVADYLGNILGNRLFTLSSTGNLPSKLPSPKIRIAMKLSDLIIYSKCVQFKSLKHSMEHQEFYESNSFSEQRVLKLIKQSVCELVQHNSRFLSRTYPSGNRRGISNYKPHEFWNVGCQMVALNYQSPGLCMDLNNGRFLTNGRCGYVLKPEFMNNDTKFNPFNPQHKRDPVTLIIQIIRGEHIPISKTCSKITVDPYVQVQIYGLPKDNAKQQSKSNNPKWNDIFTFSIQVPELALVRFTVRDSNLFSKNEFLGQYTLPFTSMKKGKDVIKFLLISHGRIQMFSSHIHLVIK
uniref:Phosphoinositide phospholipase C n=1 Tax=Callorhinchus milii TaxID=7868 RepID=A0A4W3J329_CALMI